MCRFLVVMQPRSTQMHSCNVLLVSGRTSLKMGAENRKSSFYPFSLSDARPAFLPTPCIVNHRGAASIFELPAQSRTTYLLKRFTAITLVMSATESSFAPTHPMRF